MTAAHHFLFDTAFGACGVAWGERGVVAVQLPEKSAAATERRLAARVASSPISEPPAEIRALTENIKRYLDGETIDFSDVSVDLGGLDEFRRRLYTTLRGIGFGQTITYGELAQELGLAGWEAAKTVGEAMGRNPIPIVVPCHRVVAAGNKPGGFSAHGGAATKQRLLALEGVTLKKPAVRKPEPPRLPGL